MDQTVYMQLMYAYTIVYNVGLTPPNYDSKYQIDPSVNILLCSPNRLDIHSWSFPPFLKW